MLLFLVYCLLPLLATALSFARITTVQLQHEVLLEVVYLFLVASISLDYFLKIKYTARIKKPNPIKWFTLKVSFLKKISVNAVKTTKVITS